MSKLINTIEKLDETWIFSKWFITTISLIILFSIFNPFISDIILKFLVFKPGEIESSYLFDFFTGVFFVIGGLFTWHKLQIAYKASFLHYLLFGVLIITYWFYRLSAVNWEYVHLKVLQNVSIAYLDIVIITLMIYPIVMLFKFLIAFYAKKTKEPKILNKSTFIEDIPIDEDKDDRLGYKNIVPKILKPIINDNYKKAFTIGLVGPWGNGKSSLLSLLKKELKEQSIDNIIEIEFSPFLNHNEEDIISDFFTALCEKLKKYDGTLHKEIANYSDALLKLYNTGNVFSLLDVNVDVDKSLPVYDLCKKINTSLGELNKKIIVYVDDLDRLNPIEISETLKLIRNTANFTNIVFIVALDKDYVIKTLKGDNSNKHYKFLEKFFQLEVYLPEIPQKILREEFINTLESSRDFDESDIVLINNALSNSRNLFNRFIHNIRDVKRLVNQLSFESKFVFREIDTNDYLNLIFLKINFPRFIQLLNERNEDFLECKGGKFTLIERESRDVKKEYHQEIADILNRSNSFTVDYKKYKISTVFNLQDENCFKSILGVDCLEQELLISVLVALFEERDNLPHNSIQFERNFYKVMRLSYAEDDLRESDFTQLLTFKNGEQTFYDYLEKLLSKKLGEQLMTRIEYHEVKNKQELLSLSKTLFYFWRRLDDYNLYLSEITRLLSKYLNNKNNLKFISEDVKLTKEETTDLVKIAFLDNKYVDISKKIRLLALLKENEYETGLWGLTEGELNKYSIKYYKEYLALHKDKIWDLTDFTFYSIYHQLKTISNQTELNNLLINYLKTVNIEVFCSQTLELEPFSTLSYGVSEFVVELFGNYLAFKTFLLDHKSSQTRGIQEYLKFYELLLICSFRYRRKFIFKEFTVQDYTKKHGKISEYDRSVAEKLVQIHLVFDKSLENFKPKLDDIEGFKFASHYFLYEGKTYLFFGTTQANETECLQRIFNSLKSSLVDFKAEEVILVSDWKNLTAQLKDIEGKVIIELLTIQYGK